MTYEQAYDPTIRWGANPKRGRGPSQAKSFAAKGQQPATSSFSELFHRKFMFKKKTNKFIVNIGLHCSVAEYTFSEALDLSSMPESFSFCWNGDWARDYFKHSEAKWRMLPSSRQSVLQGSRDWHCPRPTVYKSGTLVLISGRAFFCQSSVAST